MPENKTGKIISPRPELKLDVLRHEVIEPLFGPLHKYLIRVNGIFQAGFSMIIHGFGKLRSLPRSAN